YVLGDVYYEAKDYSSAHFWYLKAAEQGNSLAQNGALINVARDYSEGKGVPRDDVKAAYWLQKGADQDIAEAKVKLADMYAKGRGVRRDNAKRIALLQSAARGRSQEAIKILASLGDPGGVLQQIATEDERNRQNTARAVNEAAARRAWEQQQQQQPQRMCTQTGGGVVAMFPC
ncbi:tetratricopeptide repeat protein, partial [Burkholderia diffusa]|uniref:tetratricopeptide repeat protein n=3 Tax=Burkholderiaceae TaxID=119060 RepID=UPI002ABDAC10